MQFAEDVCYVAALPLTGHVTLGKLHTLFYGNVLCQFRMIAVPT